jgi:hypothetical protein
MQAIITLRVSCAGDVTPGKIYEMIEKAIDDTDLQIEAGHATKWPGKHTNHLTKENDSCVSDTCCPTS